MEGVSFSRLDGLEIMRGMGLEVDDMRATGGGATVQLGSASQPVANHSESYQKACKVYQ